jgi:putative spermidine/putrescine transport system permease protein
MQRVLAFCAAPAVAFFAAFWLLPVAQLLALPSKKGWDTYFAVMTNSRYLQSLVNTVSLSLVVTLLTLTLGAMVGIVLARQAFKGRQLLLSLLTLPLSFPGVIIGFFIILLGGRQGLVGQVLVEPPLPMASPACF